MPRRSALEADLPEDLEDVDEIHEGEKADVHEKVQAEVHEEAREEAHKKKHK